MYASASLLNRITGAGGATKFVLIVPTPSTCSTWSGRIGTARVSTHGLPRLRYQPHHIRAGSFGGESVSQ